MTGWPDQIRQSAVAFSLESSRHPDLVRTYQELMNFKNKDSVYLEKQPVFVIS